MYYQWGCCDLIISVDSSSFSKSELDHITFSDLGNRVRFDFQKLVMLSIVNNPKKSQFDANQKSSPAHIFSKC